MTTIQARFLQAKDHTAVSFKEGTVVEHRSNPSLKLKITKDVPNTVSTGGYIPYVIITTEGLDTSTSNRRKDSYGVLKNNWYLDEHMLEPLIHLQP